MSDRSGLFLDRHGQKRLCATLLTIEQHLDDLADAITRQTRPARADTTAYRRRKRLDGRAPGDEGAQHVADGLSATLTTAIRHVCETRSLAIPAGCRSMVGMCRWLRANVIAFAMTEGCTDWAGDIEAWGQRVLTIIDLPPDDYTRIDEARVQAANRQWVTLSTIDVVARRLGDLGQGLNERRMRTLISRDLITPDREDPASATKFYRLGDVLDAHHRHARRRRAG